jgi:predicted O-linked N-acetylglucosamine transferase (SPINDLY family)
VPACFLDALATGSILTQGTPTATAEGFFSEAPPHRLADRQRGSSTSAVRCEVCVANVADLFAAAVRHWDSGQPEQAQTLLRQVLALEPRHGGALHLLGALAFRAGQTETALNCFRQAAASDPGNALFQSSIGVALQTLGQFAEAAASHRHALSLNPNDARVLNNLGVCLAAQGGREEARSAFERALRTQPDDAEILANLGTVLSTLGRRDEAIARYREALRLRPDLAQAHNNLGNALLAAGQLDEALACFQRALEIAPNFPQAQNNLGRALQMAGKLDRAIECYRTALRTNPNYVEAHNNLSTALLARNRTADALASAREALRLRPDNAEARNTLGNALVAQGDADEAVASYREALRLEPGLVAARFNLGLALQHRGELAEARACFEEVLRRRPEDHAAHNTFVTSLNFDPRVEPAELLAEHRRWAERHAAALGVVLPHANVRDPARRLRVGYVSPDFRSHAVSYFLEPILRHHYRTRVESFCYADVAAPDATTARLRSLADQWRHTVGVSAEQLARQIREDGIDILVDLAGHTAYNRLLAFARKPAPVQVSYLGYPCSTGLPAIDYRLTDAVADPPGEPHCHTEELVRLSPIFCTYAPPRDVAEVSPLPAAASGVVTFGSLHKLEKLNADVLDAWCSLLKSVPSARLLLCRQTMRGQAAELLLRQFAERGVGPERLVLRPVEPVNRQHLRVYEEIDVLLDVFPWSGHTTACEALWMGVPVVTLRGNRHAGRMVASVLSCLGLTEWIGDTPEAYCRAAARLAGDVANLAAVRAGLRARVAGSPVCDGVGFVRGLEVAYREMWRRWCEAPAGP